MRDNDIHCHIQHFSVICLCVVVHGSVSMTQHIVISNLTSTSASAVPDLELQVAFLPDPRPRPQPESSAKTANVMANKEEVDSGTPKTVQYTWRGLRMVGEPSLFDLDEPTWHPDEKVRLLSLTASTVALFSVQFLCFPKLSHVYESTQPHRFLFYTLIL